MEIADEYKNYLKLLNDSDKFGDELLQMLLQNTSSALLLHKESHALYDVPANQNGTIHNIYKTLLYIFPQFVRHNLSKEDLAQFLMTDCSFEKKRCEIFEEFYDNIKKELRLKLLLIGNHLPHITDVKWKIDHTVKTKFLDQSKGPVFRISLKTEKFDENINGLKTEYINFTCTEEEMQDLLYKIKDAVRHCQKLTTEI